MSNSVHNGPAIDIAELKEIMDNDLELIQECFSDFLDDYPSLFADIKNATHTKDADGLNKSAHKLKGTLRYLAAENAADAAYCLELAGKESNMQDLPEKLSELERECQKIKHFINSFND